MRRRLQPRRWGTTSSSCPPSPFPSTRRTTAQRSRRLLSLAADDVLVEQMRDGNEVAFEITFERHGRAVLSFCRHMLGSAEEAEDAVQHTFVSAWRHVQRCGERELALRPWLFTVARNRCLSVLRARRVQTELPSSKRRACRTRSSGGRSCVSSCGTSASCPLSSARHSFFLSSATCPTPPWRGFLGARSHG